MSTTVRELLVRIERHIKASGISASEVGKAIMNDPTLVFRMRNGGGIQSSTIDRILRYLFRHEAKLEAEEECQPKRRRA
jgi:hypothetical protein